MNQFLLFSIDLQPYAQNTSAATFNEQIGFRVYAASVNPSSKAIFASHLITSQDIPIDKSIDRLKKYSVLLGVETKLTEGEQFYWEVTFPTNSVINSTTLFHLEVIQL